MNKKLRFTLKQFFQTIRFLPVISFAVFFIISFSLGLSAVLTKRDDLFKIGAIVFVVLGLAYLVIDYYCGKAVYHVGYQCLTEVAVENRKRLRRGKTDVVKYPEHFISDFFKWNHSAREISKTMKDIGRNPTVKDYKSLSVHYLDEDHTLISHHDFHSRRRERITLSSSYRNALREVYYPFEEGDRLSEEEFDILLGQLKEDLKEFDDIRFSPVLNDQGIYVFFPHIDSLSYLKEKTLWLQRHVSLNRRDKNGERKTRAARFAIVCYPYSDIYELFPDIHYAIRRQKPFVRYLPKRLSLPVGSSSLRRSPTRYRNITGKILSLLSQFDRAGENQNEAKEKLSSIWKRILNSFSIEYGGVILLDSEGKFRRRLSLSKDGRKPFIKEGDIISASLRKAIQSVSEEDGSYFSSGRSRRSSAIGEYADRIGFSSCFFYCIYDEKKTLQGRTFFLNAGIERDLNSYLRESLTVFSSKISSYYLVYLNQSKRKDRKRVNSSMRKIANYAYCKIDKKSHVLLESSENLNRVSKEAKPGRLCYKAFYGLDKPCADCPLITGTKKRSIVRGIPFESSLTLDDENSKNATLLIKKESVGTEPSFAGYGDDVFDRDLLINSFSTLVHSREDIYKIFGKGYLIILRFDSLSDIVKAKGSEGALLVLRSFLSGRKEGVNGTRLYRFTPGSIGLLLPNCGLSNAISVCESIDDWAREYHKKNPSVTLHISYLPIAFPQGYPAASDFLNHAMDHVSSVASQPSRNTIFFEEGNYYRVASKQLFRCDIIKEKFTNNTFRVLLQPLLDVRNKQIFGAERLLRLDDDFRKIQLNTAEVIRVAYENNRIGLISNSLLSYRGDFYRQYGNTFFKTMGVRLLTLNTSSSFLKDEDLSKKRKDRITIQHVPSGFLALEIPEKDVYDDYLNRKPFAKKRTDLGVELICDGFTGAYISLEHLKELGFSEIKIGRNVVGYIDTDRVKYSQLVSFLKDANEYGLKVGLIGVENREQYRLIKEMGYDCSRQGYAFYPPIEKEDFIKAIRHTNVSVASLPSKK